MLFFGVDRNTFFAWVILTRLAFAGISPEPSNSRAGTEFWGLAGNGEKASVDVTIQFQ